MTKTQEIKFSELLQEVVSEPGILSNAYTRFHNYSFGNQCLAAWQCKIRGIAPGPINTFNGWKKLNRSVQKGQKAIILCMPITVKKENETTQELETRTVFVFKPRWFVASQTKGAELPETETPVFSMARALKTLDIKETPFELTEGNILGYARGREIAINPVNPNPHKTRVHEVAHILLGHTTKEKAVTRGIAELEAEAVAYLVSHVLGFGGAEESRGYVQHWFKGNTVPEKSARAIMRVTDQILKAGQES